MAQLIYYEIDITALMKLDVEQHIRTCGQCLHFKAKPQCAELHPILATHPMELLHVDFLTTESGKGDKEINILVVTEHFTKYVQDYVTLSQTAKVIAQTLWDKYLMHYGLPEKIVRDQCCNFEAPLFQNCILSHKSRSSIPCHTIHKIMASASAST